MNNDEGSNFADEVFGKITTEMGTRVSDVQVDIIGDMTDMDMSTDEGHYEFNGLSEGGIYRVTPIKDIDHRNGVSTLDIILIQRHLLGLQDLDSPYKFIAADVNNSKSITALDISELRKLILEMTDVFPSNTSWRMVDAGYEFIEGANPLNLNFPERYDIYELASDMQIDFIGVKIGDVNNSAQGPEGPEIATVVRQSQSLLSYTDAKITPGKAEAITLSLQSQEDYYGLQTRINLDSDQVDLVSITSDLPGFGPEHYTYVDGVLTLSYNTPYAEQVSGGEITLSLTSLQKDIQVSDVIERDDTYVNEIYTTEGIEEVVLSSIFDGSNGFVVFQNSPNPFTDYTQINYSLASKAVVNLAIYSLDGKVIMTKAMNGSKGLNTFKVFNDDLPTGGVYYYELDNGQTRVMKRMLNVK